MSKRQPRPISSESEQESENESSEYANNNTGRQVGRKRKTTKSEDRTSGRQIQPRSPRSILKHKGNPSNQSRGAQNLSQDLSRPGPSGISRRIRSQPSNQPSTPTHTPRNNPGNTSIVRRKRRYKPGQKALKEIRYYQRTTGFLLLKMPFSRLVREITKNLFGDFRWEARALEAVQEACEAYLVKLFEDSYMCSVHSSRVTLKKSDMQLARRIRDRYESIY